MHHLFQIEELVEHIVLSDILSSLDLLNFGLTRSANWAIVAPMLWGETIVTIRMLHGLLPRLLKFKGTPGKDYRISRPLTEPEWSTLTNYTQHVRTLELDDPLDFLIMSFVVDMNIDRKLFNLAAVVESWSGPSPLFPKLRKLIVRGQTEVASTVSVLNLFIGTNIVGLQMEMDFRQFNTLGLRTSERIPEPHLSKQIVAALQVCTNLKRFELVVCNYDLCQHLAVYSPPALSNLQNLEHLQLSYRYRVRAGRALLHVVAGLPRLKTLIIRTLHIPSPKYLAEPLPSPAFISLGSFFLTLSHMESDATLADFLKWLSLSHTPHLRFWADEKESSILGERVGSSGEVVKS